jgi:hypothetical protein
MQEWRPKVARFFISLSPGCGGEGWGEGGVFAVKSEL